MSARSTTTAETIDSIYTAKFSDSSRRRGQGLTAISPRAITLLVIACCCLNLGITFFQGTLLPPSTVDLIEQHGRVRPVLKADYRIAHLQCEEYGGPGHAESQEMVYWQHIPEDAEYVSPFKEEGKTRYLTFEPDGGGFNNIRMSLETVMALAHATGRTLVLPPEQEIYLLDKEEGQHDRQFSFHDFYPIEQLSAEQKGLKVITMEEFLVREGSTGKLKDKQGAISFPPDKVTNWNGKGEAIKNELEPWLREISTIPDWDPNACMVAFPSDKGPAGAKRMQDMWDSIIASGGFPPPDKFVGEPMPVRSDPMKRLYENNKERERLCIYDEKLQQVDVLHLPGKDSLGGRLLTHFYAFLFFEDWRQDLWIKRFVRDHLRYVSEIQCAAARVVHAVRMHAKARSEKNIHGLFDAFHVRRGDFQYKKTQVSASDMYGISKEDIPDGMTVYMATDEKDMDFFKDMAGHYDLVYLDDYLHLLPGINPNMYGMIDQLVASRSRIFYGCWFSTFTGYINRIRGYHSDRHKLPGFHAGIIDSFYYAPSIFKNRMKEYWPLSGALYAREFPVSWRNIDQGIDDLAAANN